MVLIVKKKELADRFEKLLDEYESLLLIDTTNINNSLLMKMKQEVTKQIKGVFLNGKKKTFSKRCLNRQDKQPIMAKLAEVLNGNILLFFTNSSCLKTSQIISSFNRQGMAKYGQPALIDYFIKAQQTKLQPEKTKVFQKLRVPTKLTKGSIEITADFQVLEKGKPVTQMQIDILNVMSILPYSYTPSLHCVFTRGQIVDPSLYEIDPTSFSDILSDSITQTNNLALGSSFPITNVVQYNLIECLNDCLALATEISKQYEAPKEFAEKIAILSDPEALNRMKSQMNAPEVVSNVDSKTSEAKQNAKEESSESEDVESMQFDF